VCCVRTRPATWSPDVVMPTARIYTNMQSAHARTHAISRTLPPVFVGESDQSLLVLARAVSRVGERPRVKPLVRVAGHDAALRHRWRAAVRNGAITYTITKA
jgi:hypothetical protein